MAGGGEWVCVAEKRTQATTTRASKAVRNAGKAIPLRAGSLAVGAADQQSPRLFQTRGRHQSRAVYGCVFVVANETVLTPKRTNALRWCQDRQLSRPGTGVGATTLCHDIPDQ
jgi:hypothetical protein